MFILNKISQDITCADTTMRKAISPRRRLALTFYTLLLQQGIGRSVTSLEYPYHLFVPVLKRYVKLSEGTFQML